MASLDATNPTKSIAVDDQTLILGQQNLLLGNTFMQQITQGSADSSAFVRTQVQLAHLRLSEAYGAKALTEINSAGNDALNAAILGARNVAGQPQNPSPVNK